ncbi:unnamed protein product [Parascedosporium putredinis]|uniref:S-adenosyl-L-methionine-dependent methyltransferase n=1 Tax=Parascedosporium putredinis TaxID=1442378 RepID=A0A9P1H306_9PEZI|nr:unnamed protein product [Parascedosporium putredinis]CAI7994109.1 unnamed protein product [Parascedosporium putredinis]
MASETPAAPATAAAPAAPAPAAEPTRVEQVPDDSLEANPVALAEDDGYSDSGSILDSTVSLTESIFDYRKLHGRTYQKPQTTEYWIPNDEQQNVGLDIIHHVLDLGTGTGIWAVDFADQHPECEIDDFLKPWTFPADEFDFIHLRCLYGCVPDFPALYRQAFEHLKPGGWIECVEMDVLIESDHVTIPEDHVFNTWANVLYEGGRKLGCPFDVCKEHNMLEYVKKAGFVDIVEKKIKVPLHGWPKDATLRDMGYLAQAALDQSMEGFVLFMLVQTLGWTHEETMVLIANMRREMRKKSYCPWFWLTVVYARRPE